MKKVLIVLCFGSLFVACDKPKEASTEPQTPPEPPQAEIGDPKYADIGKRGLTALSSGDVDTWLSSFSDSAKYYFNGGDSLIGKKAISDYWKDRRANVIDKLEYMNDIWTPLKINKPQKGPDRAGVWLLGWYYVTASYKNGGTMSQWIHTDMHFDASDKIDVIVMYLDRVPIAAAMPKKK